MDEGFAVGRGISGLSSINRVQLKTSGGRSFSSSKMKL